MPKLFYVKPWMLAACAGLTVYFRYVVGDPQVFQAGASYSAVLFGLLCAHVVGNHVFARWDPTPPELRALHALEKALLIWNAQAEQTLLQDATRVELFRASRHPDFKDFSARLRDTARVIAQHGAANDSECASRHADVNARIREALEAHAWLTPRPRALRSTRNMPELLRALAFGVAAASMFWLAFESILPLLPTAFRPWSVRVVGSALLTYSFVWPAYFCWYLRTDYRKLANFRSLVIVEGKLVGRHRALLRELGSLGEVIGILVYHAPEDVADAPLEFGLQTIQCSPAQLQLLVGALAAHTDLIIVTSEALWSADVVRAETVKLAGRRWVFGPREGDLPAGFQPYTGYVSAEAIARRLHELSFTAAGAFAGALSTYSGWRLVYLLSATVAYLGVALLAFAPLRGLGAFCILCGWAAAFPKYLGDRRRRLRDPAMLHTPRCLWLSRAMSRYPSVGGFADGLAALAAVSFMLPALSHDWIWLTLPIAMLVGNMFLAPGLVRACKWALDWNFRIVLLRRNSPEYSVRHKVLVMPILGAYGQLALVQDAHLERAKVHWLAISAYEALAESAYALDVQSDFETWQILILREFERADFAVFDWWIDVTPNMLWELDAALSRLPAERILVLSSQENIANAAKLVRAAEARHACEASVTVLALPSRRFDAERVLRAQVHGSMTKLVRSKRAPHTHLAAELPAPAVAASVPLGP